MAVTPTLAKHQSVLQEEISVINNVISNTCHGISSLNTVELGYHVTMCTE